MNKKVISFAMAVIAAVGVSASAQTASDKTDKCDVPCCKENASCCKENAAGRNDKMARPHRFTDFAFEGILLDMPQQARMDSLNAAVKAQREPSRAQKPRRGRVSADYVAKVKEILTPEQYTTFLENIVLMPEKCAAQQNNKCLYNKERVRKHRHDCGRLTKDGQKKTKKVDRPSDKR